MTDMPLAVLPLAEPLRPLLLLPACLIIDACIGDLGPVARLAAAPGNAAAAAARRLDRQWNRPDRSAANREMRGLLTAAMIAGGGLMIGLVVMLATTPLGWGGVIEALALLSVMSLRRPGRRILTLGRSLAAGKTLAAQDTAAALTDRHVPSLDSHALARVGVEAVARSLDTRLVAPLFWYLLLGLPGLLLWTGVGAMDRVIGRRSLGRDRFGRSAARLAVAMGLVPARLTGVLIAAAAAFIGGTRPGPAFTTLWRDARRHDRPNEGWPQAAMAGALGLALGGPRREGAVVVRHPWLGEEGRARALPADIRRALALGGVASLLLLVMVFSILLAVWR